MKKVLLMLFAGCFALQVQAGGFQVNLQSIRQTGMGHTGAGLAIGPSAILFNPGALAARKTRAIELGVSPVIAKIRYDEPAPGLYSTTNEPTLSTPLNLYGAWSIGERWVAGIGVYTPFGSRVLYADDWKGQFAIREISLKTIFIQPTVSFKINDNFSVGGGFVFATGDVLLRRGVPAQDSTGAYGSARLEGAGEGFGFNAGVFYQNDAFSAGLSYRSAVRFRAEEGQATFDVAPSLEEYFPSTTFSADIRLPSTLSLGLGYKVTEDLQLALDVNYVGWSVYDTLAFDFTENTDKLDDLASPREYHNAFIFRLGASYKALDWLTARAGAYVDLSPVDAGYLTPETPDATKLGFSVGGSIDIGKHLDVDAAFLYVEGMKRYDINLETNFGGTYKGRAFIPCLGLTYDFNSSVDRPSPGRPIPDDSE